MEWSLLASPRTVLKSWLWATGFVTLVKVENPDVLVYAGNPKIFWECYLIYSFIKGLVPNFIFSIPNKSFSICLVCWTRLCGTTDYALSKQSSTLDVSKFCTQLAIIKIWCRKLTFRLVLAFSLSFVVGEKRSDRRYCTSSNTT